MPKIDILQMAKDQVARIPLTTPQKTLWRGPKVDGVTQSLLNVFLMCPERFRVMVVEGLRAQESFNVSIEYGNMWHICQEFQHNWEDALKNYCTYLVKEYKDQQEDVNKWYQLCKMQYRIYLDYWERFSKDHANKYETVETEVEFSVEINGVRVRGKFDEILREKKTKKRLWLQENKTKGDVNQYAINNQLKRDSQTMIYVSAMQELINQGQLKGEIGGVLYNVIRRPLGSGKHCIRPHKATKTKPAETQQQYYERLEGLIKGDQDYFFSRWEVPIFPIDVHDFKHQFLFPILERLKQWWELIEKHPNPFREGVVSPLHWQTPYGVYNPLAKTGGTSLDHYLESGDKLGLKRVNDLFPELKGK